MARRVGVIERFLTNLKNSFYVAKQKDTFVGSDKYGNKYFEKIGDKSHNVRASRYIEESKHVDAHEVPEVPVEWNAWLRGMRKNPPTAEEIDRNYTTMMKTKLRAAELQQRFSWNEPDLPTGSEYVAEDIKSNPQKIPFPKYKDLEVAPGEFSDKSSKVK